VLSVQPYLRLLYEECRELYVTGTPIYDAHMKENFQLRVLVADVICDFVGSFSEHYVPTHVVLTRLIF
jgi:hypothetical protein